MSDWRTPRLVAIATGGASAGGATWHRHTDERGHFVGGVITPGRQYSDCLSIVGSIPVVPS